jgi:hypothetical protein
VTDQKEYNGLAKQLISEAAKQIADRVGPLEVVRDSDDTVYFNFTVEGKVGKVKCQYEPSEEWLAEFMRKTADNPALAGASPEEIKHETRETSNLLLWIVLGFARPTFSEVMNDWYLESLAHTSSALHQIATATCEERGLSPPAGDGKGAQELVAKKLADTVKQRVGARGRGSKRSVEIAHARHAARQLGDKANEKSVAFRIGISSRTLRDLIKLENFPDWKSFMESL